MGGIPEGEDYKSFLNPESLVEIDALAEPALLEDNSNLAVQFERNGYYIKDRDSKPGALVFNKATGLKSSF
jgi:glutaminyl-tRNA synthetase